jgi:L-aspartate oxidase
MYDYIIVGSGIAGLFTALLAAEHGSVLLITKAALEESNTRYAQGGIAAAVAAEDSPRLHYADTLAAGAGLCDEAAVAVLTNEAPARIRDLLALGVPFDRQAGALALGLEGAHQARRILHAGGDATGFHIERTLCDALRRAGVQIVEGAFVTEIVVEDGRAVGVRTLRQDGAAQRDDGRAIVLASGGAGQLFAHTTNPAVATGDGLALAYRAGATLADLEFYQFHPTAFHAPGVTFLISEAVRGEGAYLRADDGTRFMPRYSPQAELAPRDVVSRAIVAEMQRAGSDHVWLDLRHLPAETMRQRFPTIAAFCAQAGYDLAADLLPVAPAAHYLMGGLRTNTWGETSLPGLFACGEVACSGVHGANRLASNSLLEGIVFGARIVQRTVQPTIDPSPSVVSFAADSTLRLDLPAAAADGAAPPQAELRALMWRQVGLIRDASGLEQARATLAAWHAQLAPARTIAEHELHNQVLLGWLMATAALERRESRGSHYRTDYPATDPAWRRRINLAAAAPLTIAAPTLALAGAYEPC